MIKILGGLIAGILIAGFLLRKKLFCSCDCEKGCPDLIDASFLNFINDYPEGFKKQCAIRRF